MADSRILMLGALKQTHQQKRVFFEIRTSKDALRLLEELRNSLMIYGYTLESKYSKIVVFLNYYRNRPTIKTIRFESRPGHRRYLSKRNAIGRFNKQGAAGAFAFTQTSSSETVLSISNEDFKNKTNHYSRSFGELLCML